jgi:hypothetical protein
MPSTSAGTLTRTRFMMLDAEMIFPSNPTERRSASPPILRQPEAVGDGTLRRNSSRYGEAA